MQIVTLAGGNAVQFISGSGLPGIVRSATVVGGAQITTLEIFKGGMNTGQNLSTDQKMLTLRSPANDSRVIPYSWVADYKGDLLIRLSSTGAGAEAFVGLD